MRDEVVIGKTLRMRDCGLDEFWLQDRIAAAPGCLELGDLEVVARERRQSSGGRLDLLLKNPEDDSMFEVELMLGETDETHIIRTIEYWDLEKRRWPQRQHFAVLVAESITRRFFNVIQLLGNAVPLIAIQANIVEADERRILKCTKVLDVYEEPEDAETVAEAHDEEYWRTKAVWTLETAKALLGVVGTELEDPTLNFVKHYVAINVNQNNLFWLHKRSANKSLLSFWVADKHLSAVTALLDERSLAYVSRRDSLRLTLDRATIDANASMFRELAKLVRDSWFE